MTVRVELSLWAMATLVAIGAVALMLRPFPYTPARVDERSSMRPTAPDSAHLVRLAGGIIATDPFRMYRQPPSARFDPASRSVVQSGIPTLEAPRPVLLLRAIVGGPPWEALLEGIPGRSGPLVVRTGDTLGELVIQSVGSDTVVIAGMDTTWRLALAGVRAWP